MTDDQWAEVALFHWERWFTAAQQVLAQLPAAERAAFEAWDATVGKVPGRRTSGWPGWATHGVPFPDLQRPGWDNKRRRPLRRASMTR